MTEAISYQFYSNIQNHMDHLALSSNFRYNIVLSRKPCIAWRRIVPSGWSKFRRGKVSNQHPFVRGSNNLVGTFYKKWIRSEEFLGTTLMANSTFLADTSDNPIDQLRSWSIRKYRAPVVKILSDNETHNRRCVALAYGYQSDSKLLLGTHLWRY